ncbi:hypothetical protein IBX65_08890, partial [Candidatus Aerophobetes bacterium]|nr:hypothetical protein [Candidatus Aerophobetes bacterium]
MRKIKLTKNNTHKRRKSLPFLTFILTFVFLSAIYLPGKANTFIRTDFTFPDPGELTFKPVEFIPPEPQRVELDNGIILYLLQDHELPIVEAQV